MLPFSLQRALAHPTRVALLASMLALAGCGGGGGSPGTVPGTPDPTNPTNPTNPNPVPTPTATMGLVDANGNALTALAGTSSGTVRVVVKNSAGALVPNAIVKFTLSDALLAFVPDSASALTDANGVAVITIKPVSVTSAGAVGITATSTVEGKTVTATANLAVGPGSVVFEPTMGMTVVNASNLPVGTLSGTQSATVRSVIKDSSGNVAPNVIVQYSVSNPLLVFTPSSGSALTDASGVASIEVMPAAVNSAGATTVTATAVVGGKTTTASTNMTVTAAPLVVSSVAFTPAPTGSLPAESKASLSVGVTAGGRPAAAAPGLTLTSLCVNDGAATLTPGAFTDGVQAVTYLNKGCGRGTDIITATLGSSTMTTSVAVDAASIGTIQFVGSNPAGQSIVLKGSGGQGRQESALLTYRVLDERNNGLAGVTVTFMPSTSTGGLSVQPASGITDSTGAVTTTVAAGTIPTPVRVLAQASRNGKTITGLSDTLIISTGLPIQKSMSLSVDTYNMNGWSIDGSIANVTVRMADQYGNPISDGTAVSFVTEGGAIGTPGQGGCVTVDGGCSVPIKSQNFRPTNGRVTVLAFVQGIEDFVDTNGDGQYSCTNFTAPDGSVPAVYRPLVDTCVSGGEPFTDQGDPFLDTGHLGSLVGMNGVGSTLDGVYTPNNGDLPFPYNRSAYDPAGNGKWGINYIRAATELTFSNNVPLLMRQVCSGAGCRDWTDADGDPWLVSGVGCSGSNTLHFRLYDLNNNPLPARSTVSATDADMAVLSRVSPNVVPSTTTIGGTFHSVVVKPVVSDCRPSGSFSIEVTAPTLQGPVSYSFGFKKS